MPEHWKAASVKRYYLIQLGKMLQNAPIGATDISVSYLKAQHVQWFGVRTHDLPQMWASLAEVTKFGVMAGDLLVCEGGEGGRSGILKNIDGPIIIQNALHRVRSMDNCLNAFLQYVMTAISDIGWFDAINNKATIAHFTQDKFGSLGIPVPPLDEQTAIVKFLDYMDRRIKRYVGAKKKLIKLLEEQKQAIIHRAVTRGLDPDVRLKPSGVEWLGDVPEHWEIQRNGQLFAQRNEIGFAELPILEVSLRTGVRTRDFGTSDRKQIMSDRGKYKRAVRGDIAYNTMRMWQGAAGVSPVDGLVSPAYVVAKARKQTESRYFGHLFRTTVFMGEVDKYSHGIVKDRNRLYWEDFKQMPSPCPPTKEQMQIADAIDERTHAIAETSERALREIKLLREYRARLIADVITGKLDVREAVATLPDEQIESELRGDESAPVLDDELEDSDADIDTELEEVEA
jgi:type I restriction enzyme S subunit